MTRFISVQGKEENAVPHYQCSCSPIENKQIFVADKKQLKFSLTSNFFAVLNIQDENISTVSRGEKHCYSFAFGVLFPRCKNIFSNFQSHSSRNGSKSLPESHLIKNMMMKPIIPGNKCHIPLHDRRILTSQCQVITKPHQELYQAKT